MYILYEDRGAGTIVHAVFKAGGRYTRRRLFSAKDRPCMIWRENTRIILSDGFTCMLCAFLDYRKGVQAGKYSVELSGLRQNESFHNLRSAVIINKKKKDQAFILYILQNAVIIPGSIDLFSLPSLLLMETSSFQQQTVCFYTQREATTIKR
jgi:hypothetical protein